MSASRYEAAINHMIQSEVARAQEAGTTPDYQNLRERILQQHNRSISVAALRVKACKMRKESYVDHAKLIDDRITRAKQLLESGLSLAEVAEQVRSSRTALRALLLKRGVRVPERSESSN